MIGDDCFGSARVFELDGLNALESVTIGTWSLTYARTDDDYGTKSDRSDGCCRIGNCPKLRSIRLGYRSFSDYHSFELCNLPSLQSLEIGDDCFLVPPCSLWVVGEGGCVNGRSSVSSVGQAGKWSVQVCSFGSDGVDGLMSQIYRYYNPLNSGNGLFQAMKGRIEGWWMTHLTTTRMSWKWRVGLGERMNRYFLTGFLPRRGQQLLCHRFGDSGEYGFAGGLTSTSLNCHPQNPLWLLQLRDGLFPSVLEHRRVFRCCCARIGYPRVWWVPLNWLYVCSDQVMDCSMICCSFRIIQLGAVIMHIL